MTLETRTHVLDEEEEQEIMTTNNIETKVKCKMCSYEHHILAPHIADEHGLEIVEYLAKYSDALWYSDYGRERMLATRTELAPKLRNREKEDVTLTELFPDWFEEGQSYEDTVLRFKEATNYTPDINPNYVFPEEQTLEMLTVLEKPVRNNIFIQGGTGTGKSDLVRGLAALLNVELFETNMDRYQVRSHLVGGHRVKGGDVYFEYGIVPKAMLAGGWLVIHEYDTADPALMNIMKPVLEDNPMIVLTEKGGEIIKAHPDFRVITTNNTWARGDDSGQFVNTEVQSTADMRRFHAFIELNYLEAEVEKKIIKKQVPALSNKDDVIDKFLVVANATRTQFKLGAIDRVLSTAEVINWCENYVLFASAHRSARVSFLRSYEPEVRKAVSEHIVNAFGREGSEHAL